MTQVQEPSRAASAMTVVRGHTAAELRDDPIRPEWVLEGDPRARVLLWATSPDHAMDHWVWECTAGRFRWFYELDETVHIVAGSVTIAAEREAPVRLEVGDSAYFRAGTWSEWTVDEYVRKHAVLRVPVPRPLQYFVNGFGRRTHRL